MFYKLRHAASLLTETLDYQYRSSYLHTRPDTQVMTYYSISYYSGNTQHLEYPDTQFSQVLYEYSRN